VDSDDNIVGDIKFEDKDYLKAIGEEPVREKPNTTMT